MNPNGTHHQRRNWVVSGVMAFLGAVGGAFLGAIVQDRFYPPIGTSITRWFDIPGERISNDVRLPDAAIYRSVGSDKRRTPAEILSIVGWISAQIPRTTVAAPTKKDRERVSVVLRAAGLRETQILTSEIAASGTDYVVWNWTGQELTSFGTCPIAFPLAENVIALLIVGEVEAPTPR